MPAPRKLIVISFLTLDGVMQAPGGREEDKEAGFDHGGWQMPYMDDGDDSIPEALRQAGGLLLGRKTYDIFAGYWPTVGKDVEFFGPIMNSLPKYVASRTLKQVPWQNSSLLDGDLAKAVGKLKAEGGKDLYLFGSGDLCQSLMREKLIDEYLVMIHPLTLGSGKRLFRVDGVKQELEVLASKTTKNGILIVTYKVKK